MTTQKGRALLAFAVIALAMAVRSAVGLWSYSGQATPPKFGDFEAQRHWMEITLHMEPGQWYVNSTENDLSWWGLDYPPAAAYAALFYGKASEFIVGPDSVALVESRGFESPGLKYFMRASVWYTDLVLYVIPLLVWFIFVEPRVSATVLNFNTAFGPWTAESIRPLLLFTLAVMQPALILIDHGHFQYNILQLGPTLIALASLASGPDLTNDLLVCLTFTFAVHSKIMALYHAPVMACALLGRAFVRSKGKLVAAIWSLVVCAAVVGAFMAVIWAPWIQESIETESLDPIASVFSRLFPFGRGLYEDKVASVWCASAPVLRLKEWFSHDALISITGLVTVASILPSSALLLVAPSPRAVLWSALHVSLGFFLFSFHVHEKSILVPLLPATMLLGEAPVAMSSFITIATWSLAHLMYKDNLLIPQAVLLIIWIGLSNAAIPLFSRTNLDYRAWSHSSLGKATRLIFAGLMVAVTAGSAFLPAPARFPDIHSYLLATVSCAGFLLIWAWSGYMQAIESGLLPAPRLPLKSVPGAVKAKQS